MAHTHQLSKWRFAVVVSWLAVTLFIPFPLVSQTQTAVDRVTALHEAAAALEQGKVAEADSLLQSLLKKAPHDAVALNLSGLVQIQKKDPEAAERLFRQAITESGDRLPGPHINLAMLYGEARQLAALDELKAALAIKPDNRQAQDLLRSLSQRAAGEALRSKRTAEALNILAQAHEILPHDPEISFNQGMALFECGMNENSESALLQALQERPEYPQATYALARVYLAENKAPQAEEQMRKYLLSHPDDATAQYGMGYILVAEQKFAEAQAAFHKSLALQPAQTESLFQLGEIALEQGDTATAKQELTEVLKRDPHHAGALTDSGILSFRSADYNSAKVVLEEAISSAPSYQKAHYYYALTLSKLGNKAEAEREFTISKQLQKAHVSEPHL